MCGSHLALNAPLSLPSAICSTGVHPVPKIPPSRCFSALFSPSHLFLRFFYVALGSPLRLRIGPAPRIHGEHFCLSVLSLRNKDSFSTRPCQRLENHFWVCCVHNSAPQGGDSPLCTILSIVIVVLQLSDACQGFGYCIPLSCPTSKLPAV